MELRNRLKIFKMVFVVSEKEGMHGKLLIITDAEILGKKFNENNFQLDLTKEFYQGKEKNEKEVRNMITTVKHLHFTGKASVALALHLGLVEVKRILYVKGIPHAETVIEE